MKLSCVIVDDEPMALSLMEGYVSKTPFLELKYKFSNAIQAIEVLNTEEIEVLFLDIQMPDLTGIEFSRMIPKYTKIVFTTAFDQYAIEGFKVDALDYLLKPFDYAEFFKAANKAREWFILRKQQSVAIVERVKDDETAHKEFLFVKSEYRQLRIRLDDVLYFEGLKDYIKIWLRTEDRPILTLMSLKSLEAQLQESDFMRVHRSFIVSLKNIEVIERSQIVINKQRITVSEQYKPKFLEYIQHNSI